MFTLHTCLFAKLCGCSFFKLPNHTSTIDLYLKSVTPSSYSPLPRKGFLTIEKRKHDFIVLPTMVWVKPESKSDGNKRMMLTMGHLVITTLHTQHLCTAPPHIVNAELL